MKGYPPQSPIPFKLQSVAYTDCFVTGHPLRSSDVNMVDGIPIVSERMSQHNNYYSLVISNYHRILLHPCPFGTRNPMTILTTAVTLMMIKQVIRILFGCT